MGTKPYTCPVCNGTTAVEKGFYPDEPERTDCKACFNGILWGTTDEYTWIPQYQYTPQQFYPPANMFQCSTCGVYYSGTHNCMGKMTYYSVPSYIAPTGSNPPSVGEVEQQLGMDYLNPGLNVE